MFDLPKPKYPKSKPVTYRLKYIFPENSPIVENQVIMLVNVTPEEVK